MTDCVNVASTHAKKTISNYQCVFVNEVLESKKLQTFKFESILSNKDNDADVCQFHKHINRRSPQPTETDYKKDCIYLQKGYYLIDYNTKQFKKKNIK